MFTFSFTQQKVSEALIFGVLGSVAVFFVLSLGFSAAEPRISHGQESASSTFYIRQTITDETSFQVEPANVTMNATISGLTGGQATGTSGFVVLSNNATGYYVEIDFFDNAGVNAMRGDITGSDAIEDYNSATNTPTFGYVAPTSGNGGEFAYTVVSSTTLDTGQLFLNNGSYCNAGTQDNGDTTEDCWMAPSTTAVRIIDRDSSASAGASSTLTFNVTVPNNPSPIPSAETYTATATLSLFTQ